MYNYGMWYLQAGELNVLELMCSCIACEICTRSCSIHNVMWPSNQRPYIPLYQLLGFPSLLDCWKVICYRYLCVLIWLAIYWVTFPESLLCILHATRLKGPVSLSGSGDITHKRFACWFQWHHFLFVASRSPNPNPPCSASIDNIGEVLHACICWH